MKLVTKILPFILFLSFNFSEAQNFYSRALQWNNPVQMAKEQADMPLDGKSLFNLNFVGASYENTNTMLPYYIEVLSIDNASVRYSIENIEYKECFLDPTKKIQGISQITQDISFTQKLYFNRGQPFLELKLIPLRRNPVTGKVEQISKFTLLSGQTSVSESNRLKTKHTYIAKSILNSGTWYKFRIEKDGMYRFTLTELKEMGITNLQNVRIFGSGGKMLSFLNNDEDTDDLQELNISVENDAILFYAQGPDEYRYDETKKMFIYYENYYSGYSWYFITADVYTGYENKIKSTTPVTLPYTQQVNSFVDFWHHELRNTNFINSGFKWYGESYDIDSYKEFTPTFPNSLKNSNIKARISVIARSPESSSFEVTINGQKKNIKIDSAIYDETSDHAEEADSVFTVKQIDNNLVSISLKYLKSTAQSEAWLDFITINASRELKMTGTQMQFRYFNPSAKENITEFLLSGVSQNIIVWDITDLHQIQQVSGTLIGEVFSFKLKTDANLKTFIAFDKNSGFSTPVYKGKDDVGVVANQNLHGSFQVPYIIVTHPRFLTQARELAAFHLEKDQLTSLVATTDQIYNEFSSGTPDASAIRNFIRMFYNRAAGNSKLMPKYILLFGDGSFDNKTVSEENSNFVPTYQTENSLNPTRSFVSDDFYGLLDQDEGGADGLLDVGIGRIPVQTEDEAKEILKKIIHYCDPQTKGDWLNVICFVADDEDGNLHMLQAEKLSEMVYDQDSVINVDKIFLDAYQQITAAGADRYPEVNEALRNRIEKGALIINYTGHGNEEQLAHEKIIDKPEIDALKNFNNLPIFMTATCEFTRFDYNLDNDTKDLKRSAGEHLYMNPNGGAIALFSTTRLVYASENALLNESFYKCVFKLDENKQHYRLGEIMRQTKNDAGSSYNKRNFTLLGDPAIQLQYPVHNVITSKLNGIDIRIVKDTLKALSKVNLSGIIKNASGQLLTDFTGTIYVTVFDKMVIMTTLGNDGDTPVEFKLQNNILYKGKASVTNGIFTISFIVPKDISYKTGFGKISYYAENGITDANGFFDKVLIGGSATNFAKDNDGPQIDLFMNDKNFISGSLTNANPKLLAFLKDSSGINTVGNGIGHDITVVLNDNTNKTLILNDYYQADKDSYQSGKIEYPFSKLPAGPQKLKLKVWDIHNNSADATIEFLVVESENLKIDHVLNFPNPFTDKTAFYFEHNYPFTNLDVLVQIFTVTGKLVKSIETQMTTNGFMSLPVNWDGFDDYGNKLGRGVYVYKLKVQTPDGKKAEKFEKLLILK